MTSHSGRRVETRAPTPGPSPIAAVAIDEGFSELVAPLTYVDTELDAGLVNLFLEGDDRYTVFAPTDEALGEPYGSLGSVLETEIDEISDLPAEVVLHLLLYHVTAGRRAANSVVPTKQARKSVSPLGESFRVRAAPRIEDRLTGLGTDASIVGADVSASNGIIYVIDQVIVPPSAVAALTS